MAGITVSGIGSGLDIGGIVDKLVAAERAPEAARIQRAQSDTRTKLSALTGITSSLVALQTALGALATGSQGAFAARKVTSGDDKIVSASATNGAQTGSYDIEVAARASAHELLSAPLAGSTGLGAGRLHIVAGSKSFDVDIVGGSDTPAGIRDAITTAAAAAGARISAGTIQGDAGTSLVISSLDSGAANAIRITRTSGSAGLDALVYDPGTLVSMTERRAAADATVRIDGITRTAASNRIADAIPGVTLDLVATNTGSTVRLDIGTDDAAAGKAANAFVSAYNSAIDTMNRATAYGGTGGTSGPLIGDSMVRGANGRLRGEISTRAGELVALGINTDNRGRLSLNTGKLTSALAADPAGTLSKLSSLGGALKTVVDSYVGTDGLFSGRSSSLNARLRGFDDATQRLDARMEDVHARFIRQFSALDSLVGSMNTTSQFLQQQLASLNSSN